MADERLNTYITLALMLFKAGQLQGEMIVDYLQGLDA